MTNLDHLERAELRLKEDGRFGLAHVVQDAREEIAALRAELKIHRKADVELMHALAAKDPS